MPGKKIQRRTNTDTRPTPPGMPSPLAGSNVGLGNGEGSKPRPNSANWSGWKSQPKVRKPKVKRK